VGAKHSKQEGSASKNAIIEQQTVADQGKRADTFKRGERYSDGGYRRKSGEGRYEDLRKEKKNPKERSFSLKGTRTSISQGQSGRKKAKVKARKRQQDLEEEETCIP